MAVEWKKIAFADDLHAAVTIDGTSPLSLSGQAISLKNDAAAAITEIDTGALSALDTTIPTSLTVREGLPNRNIIINGGMDVWQRGTATLVSPATWTYFPDRFAVSYSLGDGTFSAIRSAETVSSGFPFQYSLKIDCTHIETAVAASELMSIKYYVEGLDFVNLEGQTATLSFWAKAVKAGTYCVALRNNAVDKAYVHEYTLAANTWTRVTFTLTFNSGGTFLYTNGVGLRIEFMILGGSNWQTATVDQWVSGNYLCTANQVNGFDSTSNDFYLTGVQLELGPVATPFETRSFADELTRCQRYYEKSYSYDVAPYTSAQFCVSQPAATVQILPGSTLRTTKRAAPTVTIIDQAGTASKVSDSGGSPVGSAATAIYVKDGGWAYVRDTGNPYTAGTLYFYNWTAVAEL